jgi:hypothetical protein
MRNIIITGLVFALSTTAFAQEAKQNKVDTAGAPGQTDAEPGYWTNLFENTIRYTVNHPAGKQEIDIYFNRDKTVTSNAGFSGKWHQEGAAGKEQFCYSLGDFSLEPKILTECFPLRLMNNPRIGARWGGKLKPDIPYQAVVVKGREKEPKQNATNTAGAPTKTDAEPDYWKNLFENTMRYTFNLPDGKQEVDVYFNRDKTVTSNTGLKGVWRQQGEVGKEQFCYNLDGFTSGPKEITQCFPLRRMNNPRIGATWTSTSDQGTNYRTIVVKGREKDPRNKKS